MIRDRIVDQSIDLDRLQGAFRSLVARHSALRHAVVPENPHRPEDPMSWWHAYSLREAEDPVLQLEQLAPGARFGRPAPFDLTAPPFVRLQVADSDDGTQHLRMTLSHMVFDGMSDEILWRDLDALYGDAPLPPTDFEWPSHFAALRASWVNGEWDSSRSFWLEQLQDLEPFSFPSTGAKLSIWPLMKGLRLDLSESELAALRQMHRELRLTRFAAGVGLLGVALREVLMWRDVALVMPVANRSAVTWDAVGLFANLVYVRFRLDDDPPMVQRSARNALLGTLGHGHYPLFLLGAESPEIRQLTQSLPRVAVRQPEPHARGGAAGPPETFRSAFDLRDRPVADDFGLGADLLVDFFFEDPTCASIRITYRADKIDGGIAADILDCIRDLICSGDPNSPRRVASR